MRNFRGVAHRYDRLARAADACVVFADFDARARARGPPGRGPDPPEDVLGNEWAVVIDAPGYAACLLAWETPESQRDDHLPDRERRFEALWTLDPRVVRRAALVGAALAGARRRAGRASAWRGCCATGRSRSRRRRRR